MLQMYSDSDAKTLKGLPYIYTIKHISSKN